MSQEKALTSPRKVNAAGKSERRGVDGDAVGQGQMTQKFTLRILCLFLSVMGSHL